MEIFADTDSVPANSESPAPSHRVMIDSPKFTNEKINPNCPKLKRILNPGMIQKGTAKNLQAPLEKLSSILPRRSK